MKFLVENVTKYTLERWGKTTRTIAAHAWDKEHRVVWESARVRTVETNYCRRRVSQTLHIKKQDTSNLDCGLHFIITWTDSWFLMLGLPPSFSCALLFVCFCSYFSLAISHSYYSPPLHHPDYNINNAPLLHHPDYIITFQLNCCTRELWATNPTLVLVHLCKAWLKSLAGSK